MANVVRTKKGRRLRPDNCPPDAASRLLSDRRAAKKGHKKRPKRVGRCDYRAAEYALHRGRGAASGPDVAGFVARLVDEIY